MNNCAKQLGGAITGTMITLILVCIFGLTMYTNVARYQLTTNDNTTESEVQQTMSAIQGSVNRNGHSADFFLYQTGPGTLPAPMGHVKISQGVTLFAAKWERTLENFGSSMQLFYSYGYHDYGCNYFIKLKYNYAIGGLTKNFEESFKYPIWGRSADC